ncbi:hypothetical protein M409DRAFT_19642 [Zasmidium cellare ATCC 36951]|uniref:Uncharacterized protein n=1 Tax=Zasmidium cellare ATCC 36951 TaxID=1080233 RepID=A0A6A6CW51_ZASCE|nr:uncharacterized protein M409DRAFT_19642 [Zasmidium cellare ATCC 36951]KAF2170029.1 hypothetical protein M409DRAFT_19642 [Zasmidium cellare ATCC 36951]
MSNLTVESILQDEFENDPNLQPKHIRHDCECRIVEAPLDAITTIVDSGGVPILNLEPNGTDKLGLVAKAVDGTTKYVAVWNRPDDEFASSKYNTITTCQLIRLADRLGALHMREGGVEICFWMPALCLPSDLENEVTVPPEVYSNVYAVLIMDSDWLSQLNTDADEEAAYQHVLKLRTDFAELNQASRLLLIGPLGFHIEVDIKDATDNTSSQKE